PLSIGVALVSALQIRGQVLPYLFAPALAVGVVAWVVAGATVAEALPCVSGMSARRARRFVAVIAVVLTLLAMVLGREAFNAATSQQSPAATELRGAVDRLCGLGRDLRVTSEHAQWYEVVSVAAALGECASNVKIDHHLEYIVGARRVERGPAMA